MNFLTQEHLERCFRRAKEHGAKYIGLCIRMKDYEKDEIIINPAENFDDKLAYYNLAYDDELNHRHAEGVAIVGFTYGNSFEKIENDLIG